VSLLKQLTVPRLELLAATIGARLAVSVKKEIEQGEPSLFFWSDSSTVIAWIQREDSWGIFVWNRIEEIRSLTTKEAWRHVPGAMNPADLPSRGCSVRQLLDSKEWEGPPWLKLSPEDWPSEESQPDEDMVMQERKKTIVSSLLCKDVKADWYYSFSNDNYKVV
jgi:hypothetical protein